MRAFDIRLSFRTYETRRTGSVVVLILGALAICGCGGKQSEKPTVAPAPAAVPQAASPSAAPAHLGTTVARMRVVDLHGSPMANMMPIASIQPNAFDEPIAQGTLTGADGLTTLAIPSEKTLCLRAWDPTRRTFANNYYEVLPGEASETELMEITMVPGCALEAELHAPDGSPIANENVGLMMFHPTRGAWWPDEADSDTKGRVRFPCVPPGRFVLKLKAASGPQVELPETPFPPSGTTNLGVVALQQPAGG